METIKKEIAAGETEQIIVGNVGTDHVVYVRYSATDGAMAKSGRIEILSKGNLVMKSIALGDNFTLTFDRNISGSNIILTVTSNAGGSGVIFRYYIEESLKLI